MKKKIIALALAAAAVLSLTACGKKFTCDICCEEKTGKSYTRTVAGKEVVYCQECRDQFEKWTNEFMNLIY